MLCEYPLVSLSVVYHTLFPVWMVRIPREPVLKALRTTIPEVRVEMIIRCFFSVNVFMTLSQDEDFLKYLTDPASRKAKPHCMKNMTIALKHIQIHMILI